MKSFYKLVKNAFFMIALILFLTACPSYLFAQEQEAVFAGGCFWCLEHDLEELTGVISAESGYSGGELDSPTYQNHIGHQEVVKVLFDTEKMNYENLLRSYWRNIDPLDGEGQFCDRGDSYRPVVFTNDESQRTAAMNSLEMAAKELNQPVKEIKVEIRSRSKFWLAEDYHQNYAQLNPLKYNFYRYSCGRDLRLEKLWNEKARTDQEWS